MNLRIRDYAHPVKEDIDPDDKLDANAPDYCVNGCVCRATEALKNKATGLSELDRINLSSIFKGMQFTHKSIQILLSSKEPEPTSVDALTLARSQLESLYAICLMVEDPKWISAYIKDGWNKQYKLFLLQREEYKHLPRCRDELDREMLPAIENLQKLCGITEGEKKALENYELGTSAAQPPRFPNPMKIIEKVSDKDRKQMLMRLYAEYGHLSSYVHGLPSAMMLRGTFADDDLSSTGNKEIIFQKQVAGPSIWTSCLSVAQSSSELTCLYPNDIELRAKVAEAWNLLTRHSLLGKAIWEFRTRKLLGSI